MVPKKCLICCRESFSKKTGTQDANSTSFPSAENFNRQQAEESNNGETDLQILFLLRKLLEIPESTCCLLREHFGKASVWIECCDSCLDLVEKCKAALEQAELFQKQYEELRTNIKTTMLKSQKTFISESKCEIIVRSLVITQEIDNFINTTATGTDEEVFPDRNVNLDANNLTVPVLFEKINIVKSEEDDITISFNENNGMDCNLESTDFGNGIQSGNFSCEKEQEQSNCETIQSDNRSTSGNDDNLDQFDVSAKQNKIPQENLPSINSKVEVEPRVSERGTTSNAEKKHKCHTCLKLFGLPQELKVHLRSHFSTHKKSVTKTKQNVMKRGAEESHKCKICGKSFTHFKSLKYHMAALHNGEKPFVCAICGQGFPFPGFLKQHSKLHSGEKPFECNVCAKAFVKISHLKNHQMTHSQNKPFKCDICGKSFKWKYNLIRHRKTHDEEIS